MISYEQAWWSRGCRYLAGIDEAGRGPLAGPVVAAAVFIEQQEAVSSLETTFSGITDSKQLSPESRETFYRMMRDTPSVRIGIGFCNHLEIDELNILRATHLAMRRAVVALSVPVEGVLVDGRPVEGLPCISESIVKGDSQSLLIAAGSIAAKVVRDACMREYDRLYPGYGFADHKGYGTRAHIQALLRMGPSPIHRFSFRPVREAYETRTEIASRKKHLAKDGS